MSRSMSRVSYCRQWKTTNSTMPISSASRRTTQDGVVLGRVTEILNFGGGDILEIAPEGGGETLLVPFTKAAAPVIDIAGSFVIVVPPAETDADSEADAFEEAPPTPSPRRAEPCGARPSSRCSPRCFQARSACRWPATRFNAASGVVETRDIRDQGLGRHRAVDDTPAGGGAGMVLRADVLAASLDAGLASSDARPRFLMSPRGKPLTQPRVRELSQGEGAVFVCGRFEGSTSA